MCAKAVEVGATASKLDSAMTATGEQMSTLAQTVREKAPEGKAGEIASKAADALDRGGEYLQRADLQTLRSDNDITFSDLISGLVNDAQ